MDPCAYKEMARGRTNVILNDPSHNDDPSGVSCVHKLLSAGRAKTEGYGGWPQLFHTCASKRWDWGRTNVILNDPL